MFQKTIKKSVEVVGIGLHSGEPIRLILEPLHIKWYFICAWK